jgi:MFS family permease
MLRALTHRNFRLFFGGQTLSLIGTWTQSVAMPWLVHRLSQSELVLGLAAFSAQLPSFFLPPIAGVVTDRVDRHRLLIATQSFAMIQAFVLAALVLTDRVQIWSLVLLNFSLSAINAFDITARQTFLGDMLDNKEDLANAIALNASLVNGARLFAPALAAQLIAWLNEGACFFVNALSFVAVLLALLAMRIKPRPEPTHRPSFTQSMREGFRYVTGSPPIRAVLLVVSIVSLFGLSYSLLLPVYVHHHLDGTAQTYGWLMTAPGVGAFTAGMWLAWRGMKGVLIRIALSPITAGLCLAGFVFQPSLPLAIVLLFGSGFSFLTLLNSCNTLLQTYADEDKRGRVMSFYSMAFLGMAPLGSLLIGALAQFLGVTFTLALCGSLCAAGGIYFQIVRHRWQDEVRATIRAKRVPPPASREPEDLAPPAATEVPPPMDSSLNLRT